MPLNTFRAELHVHTLLSPCAEVEMIPPLIVQEALSRNIRMIAITDHNNTANAAAVMKAAQGTGLTVLPGMELQTREEVHTLCIFESIDQAEEMNRWVTAGLPDLKNNPVYFGEQFVVDETGDFIRREDQMLLVSTIHSLDDAYAKVRELDGLFIPAHVNRSAFGLLPILGLVPTEINVDALEVSRHLTLELARKQFPQLKGQILLQGGDVHRLDEFLGANIFTLEEPTLPEIRLALAGQSGRGLEVSTILH